MPFWNSKSEQKRVKGRRDKALKKAGLKGAYDVASKGTKVAGAAAGYAYGGPVASYVGSRIGGAKHKEGTKLAAGASVGGALSGARVGGSVTGAGVGGGAGGVAGAGAGAATGGGKIGEVFGKNNPLDAIGDALKDTFTGEQVQSRDVKDINSRVGRINYDAGRFSGRADAVTKAAEDFRAIDPRQTMDTTRADSYNASAFGKGRDMTQSARDIRGAARSLDADRAILVEQMGAMGQNQGYLRDVMLGNAGPSAAERERQFALEQAQRQALSTGASARQAGGYRAALAQQQALSTQAAQQGMVMRAQEQAQARGEYAQALQDRGAMAVNDASVGQTQGNLYNTAGTLQGEVGRLYGDAAARAGDIEQARAQAFNDAKATSGDLYLRGQDLGLQADQAGYGQAKDQTGFNVDIAGTNANIQTGNADRSLGAQKFNAEEDRIRDLAAVSAALGAADIASDSWKVFAQSNGSSNIAPTAAPNSNGGGATSNPYQGQTQAPGGGGHTGYTRDANTNIAPVGAPAPAGRPALGGVATPGQPTAQPQAPNPQQRFSRGGAVTVAPVGQQSPQQPARSLSEATRHAAATQAPTGYNSGSGGEGTFFNRAPAAQQQRSNLGGALGGIGGGPAGVPGGAQRAIKRARDLRGF